MVVAKKPNSKKADREAAAVDTAVAATDQAQELELLRSVMNRCGAMTAEIEAAKQDLELAEEAKRDAEDAYDVAKNRVSEAKSRVQGAERTLLRFMNPTNGEWHPLFDTMDAADEELHGKGSDKWRQEPISALKLSLASVQALTDAEILFVGQLQDRVLKDARSWWESITGLNNSVAAAIVDKLNDFICDRTE